MDHTTQPLTIDITENEDPRSITAAGSHSPQTPASNPSVIRSVSRLSRSQKDRSETPKPSLTPSTDLLEEIHGNAFLVEASVSIDNGKLYLWMCGHGDVIGCTTLDGAKRSLFRCEFLDNLSARSAYNDQRTLASIMGIPLRLRPPEDPAELHEPPVRTPTTPQERTPSRQGSIFSVRPLFTPSNRDTASPASSRRRPVMSHIEVITVRRRTASSLPLAKPSQSLSLPLVMKSQGHRRFLDYVSIPSLECLLEDPEWRELREAHFQQNALDAGYAEDLKWGWDSRADPKGKGKARVVDEESLEEDEVDRALEPGSRGLTSSPLSKSGRPRKGGFPTKTPQSSKHHREHEAYSRAVRVKHRKSSGYDYATAGPSSAHRERSVEWIEHDETSESNVISDLDFGTRGSSVSSYHPPNAIKSNTKVDLRKAYKENADGSALELRRRKRRCIAKPKGRLSEDDEWRASDSSKSEWVQPGRWLRPLTTFSEEDQLEIDKLEPTWCHQCHKQKIVMPCHNPIRINRKASCGTGFCDQCLSKYPLPFNPLKTFHCPKCRKICSCAACRRRNNPGNRRIPGPKKRKRFTGKIDDGSTPSIIDSDDVSVGMNMMASAPRTPPPIPTTLLGKRPRSPSRSRSHSLLSRALVNSASTAEYEDNEDNDLLNTHRIASPFQQPIEDTSGETEPPLEDYNSPEHRMSYLDEMKQGHSDPPLVFRSPSQVPRSTGTQKSPDNPNYIMRMALPYYAMAARRLDREKSNRMKGRSGTSLQASTLLKDRSAVEDGTQFQRARRKYKFNELDPTVTLPGQTWAGDVGMFGFDSESAEGPESTVDETRALSLSLEGHEVDGRDGEDASEPIGIRMDEIELHHQETRSDPMNPDVEAHHLGDSVVQEDPSNATPPSFNPDNPGPDSPEMALLDVVNQPGSLEGNIYPGADAPHISGPTAEVPCLDQAQLMKALAAVDLYRLSTQV